MSTVAAKSKPALGKTGVLAFWKYHRWSTEAFGWITRLVQYESESLKRHLAQNTKVTAGSGQEWHNCLWTEILL